MWRPRGQTLLQSPPPSWEQAGAGQRSVCITGPFAPCRQSWLSSPRTGMLGCCPKLPPLLCRLLSCLTGGGGGGYNTPPDQEGRTLAQPVLWEADLSRAGPQTHLHGQSAEARQSPHTQPEKRPCPFGLHRLAQRVRPGLQHAMSFPGRASSRRAWGQWKTLPVEPLESGHCWLVWPQCQTCDLLARRVPGC